MRHLLIDFENLQPSNLDHVPVDNTHIWLFVGAVQKTMQIELAQSLCRFGDGVHWVRIKKTGKNALDFYLSYYLGQITATDREAVIGILSKDGGYDVLVEHIEDEDHARNIIRLSDCGGDVDKNKNSSIININPPPPRQLAPYFKAALSALRHPDAFRPSRLHNLQQNLKNHVLTDLLEGMDKTEQDLTVSNVIRKLMQQKLVALSDEENKLVVYHLDNDAILSRIKTYVLSVKPKNTTDFQAAVQFRAEALCLTISDDEINAFTDSLVQQKLLKIDGNNIMYPPFETKTAQSQVVSKQNMVTTDVEKWQKLLKIIDAPNRPNTVVSLQNHICSILKCDIEKAVAWVSKLQDHQCLTIQGQTVFYCRIVDEAQWNKLLSLLSKKNRPVKLNSLHNSIKATFKCGDTEAEAMIQQLQNTKHISLNGTKIVY